MGRLHAVAIVWGVWFALTSVVLAAGPVESVSATVGGLDSDALVQRLGDRSFAVRRAATARLVELGVASIEALQRGVQSADREISFRSQHVLKIVREHDFQRRLRSFAAGIEPIGEYQLPSWARFSKEVGTGPDAQVICRNAGGGIPTTRRLGGLTGQNG